MLTPDEADAFDKALRIAALFIKNHPIEAKELLGDIGKIEVTETPPKQYGWQPVRLDYEVKDVEPG